MAAAKEKTRSMDRVKKTAKENGASAMAAANEQTKSKDGVKKTAKENGASAMAAAKEKTRSKDQVKTTAKENEASANGHATKRSETAHRKVPDVPEKQKEKQQSKANKPISSKQLSVLRGEEAVFPRGGGSVLTPLEYRQIKVDAQRDVLFEQSGKGTKRKPSEEYETEVEAPESAVPSTRRKRSKAKVRAAPVEPQAEESPTRIEGLALSRMVPGTLVLGQVSQITADDIGLAIPNNLTGFVPITAVSKQATDRISVLTPQNDSDQSSDGEATEDSKIDLSKLFSIGRYLRACVVAVRTGPLKEGAARGKRHVELSVDPRLANRGLSKTDIISNVVVQASVVSVEDHGLVMEVGLSDASVKGFMPSSEIPSDVEFSNIEPGTVFLSVVAGQSSDGKIVKLSTNFAKGGKGKKGKLTNETPTIDAVLPGTAVEMSVLEVETTGVAGKIMGTVDAMADVLHSGATSLNANLAIQAKSGQKTLCRVIYTLPKAEPKKVGVSLLRHVRELSTIFSKDGDGSTVHPLEALPIGVAVKCAKVIKVVSHVGLWLDLQRKDILGFAHISTVSDQRIERLSESTGPYRVGSEHVARVTGYNAVDGFYVVSLEETILKRPFLRIEDVQVGQVVKGTIEKLIRKDDSVSALLVKLAPGITGLVPGIQFSDVKLSHPEKKFKEGGAVKVRVLSNDVERKLLRLTLKKSLVRSDLPVLQSYEQDAPSGSRFVGTIVDLMHSGAIVQFFGPVRAFLPRGDMSEGDVDDPRKDFRLGQVVTVQVVSMDSKKRKVVVSCKDTPTSAAAQDRGKKTKRAREGGEEAQKETKKPKTKEVDEEDGLKMTGFDWTGDTLDQGDDDNISDEPGADAERPNKKKRRRAEIQVDRTGDLDAHGPQSVADFERLLLGEPDSSVLWIKYMAFQLKMGEVAKAREIAKRALGTIDITEEEEKMNIWIALMNLENDCGSDESLQEVFSRACQYNDAQNVHERLITIYIQSGKYEQADALLQTLVKKFSQSPSVWLNYATFLMLTVEAHDRARSLLPRATQALPAHQHLDITLKFAQLEFDAPRGNPERGRTFLEGLIATWPKRLDLWHILLSLEMRRGEKDRVRSLFERIVAKGLKSRKVESFFKSWVEFEEKQLAAANSDRDAVKRVESVKARAAQYALEHK